MIKTKMLITGGAGFIFSNFIRHILYKRKDYEIVSIDSLINSHSMHNIYANKGHTCHVGDISDEHFINRIFEITRPDIVINGAAQSFVDASIQSAVPFIKSNVLGTQVIVDACLKYKVDRLIQISTDEVFGQLNNDSEPSWTEESTPNPRNPYSASKYSSELVVKAAHVTHGLNYNITRSCNNIGPRQSTRNLIPKIIKNILNNEKVPIYGQGMQTREWIHCFDKSTAIETILDKAPPNEIYNISTGWEISNVEMFNKICNIMGKGHNLLKFIKDPRPGHDFRYSIDSTKLRNLGWKPKFTFNEALANTIKWFVDNQWYMKY
jgi:dTDP-glucose 4,6-dehydratase